MRTNTYFLIGMIIICGILSTIFIIQLNTDTNFNNEGIIPYIKITTITLTACLILVLLIYWDYFFEDIKQLRRSV